MIDIVPQNRKQLGLTLGVKVCSPQGSPGSLLCLMVNLDFSWVWFRSSQLGVCGEYTFASLPMEWLTQLKSQWPRGGRPGLPHCKMPPERESAKQRPTEEAVAVNISEFGFLNIFNNGENICLFKTLKSSPVLGVPSPRRGTSMMSGGRQSPESLAWVTEKY